VDGQGHNFFWTVFSHCQRLCSTHVADVRIQGAWRTRQSFLYTCVGMASCQGMRMRYMFPYGELGTPRVIAEEEHDYYAGLI
jgi:hypothetical protein